MSVLFIRWFVNYFQSTCDEQIILFFFFVFFNGDAQSHSDDNDDDDAERRCLTKLAAARHSIRLAAVDGGLTLQSFSAWFAF